MAGFVLNLSSVFQLNFCASISATSPSSETLAVVIISKNSQRGTQFADCRLMLKDSPKMLIPYPKVFS